jgi:sugar-specific transcriptional regulator TrmB
MMLEEAELTALSRLGLTDYEARIYLVLVKFGPIKASEVSFFGRVPRTKTYGAIKELERKGLLRVIPGKPEMYAPASPIEVLMPLATKLNREAKDSEAVIQQLALAYESRKFVKREIPEEASKFWEIEGRENIVRRLNQIFGDASKSIDYCTSVPGLVRAYKAHSEALEKAISKGTVVRVISAFSAENSAVAQQFAEFVDVRRLEKPLGATFVSVDSSELVVIDARPDDFATDRGSDQAIWTTNKLLVGLYGQLFERIWSTLPATDIQYVQRH